MVEGAPSLPSLILPGTPEEVRLRYLSLADRATSADFGPLEDDVVVLDTETTGLSFKDCDLIEISAARTGSTVRLTVFNEGDGLPEEELPRIWEKFYRTDRARTRAAGGTGIGLPLVRAIADTLHGSCGVRNVPGGIAFWFELSDAPDTGAGPAAQ